MGILDENASLAQIYFIILNRKLQLVEPQMLSSICRDLASLDNNNK